MSRKIVIKFMDTLFTNEFSWSARCDVTFDVSVYSHYTGHLHYNSPYEQDDICGNCDGAKCDSCRKTYEISVRVNDIRSVRNIIINEIRSTNISNNNEEKYIGYNKAHEIYENIITGEDYYDSYTDIVWSLESLEDIEFKYPEYYKYIIREVYIVGISFNSTTSVLGTFNCKEDAINFLDNIKNTYDTNPNFEKLYSENENQSTDSYCYRNKIHGNNKMLDTSLYVSKKHMGEITLLNYETKNEKGTV